LKDTQQMLGDRLYFDRRYFNKCNSNWNSRWQTSLRFTFSFTRGWRFYV